MPIINNLKYDTFDRKCFKNLKGVKKQAIRVNRHDKIIGEYMIKCHRNHDI